MAHNVSAAKRGFHYNVAEQSLDLFVDGVKVDTWGGVHGRKYFVNNITGSDTNDGRSWNSAVAQINQAVTLSETYRELGGDAPDVSTNDYIRNTIMVQGTGTAYLAVTALPGFADVIGLGADPTGNGYGIARMDGAGAAAACTVSATTRGVNLYNLQFTQLTNGAYYGLDVTAAMYRSRIEHCGFTNNASGGIHFASVGSLVMDDCHTMSDSFESTYGMVVGAIASASGNFNNCKITNCYFRGTTAGLLTRQTSCGNTWIDHCFFLGGTYGFQELNASTQDAHQLRCTDSYAFGTNNTTSNQTGFVVDQSHTKRFMRCVDNANGSNRAYPTMDMEY